MARILADELTREFKEAVVVQNKPGASGTAAASSSAGAKPDGYTRSWDDDVSLCRFFLVPDISYKLSDFAPSRESPFSLSSLR
jgi:tripartite-type tricarboxylate transporter receptor subunit TctC